MSNQFILKQLNTDYVSHNEGIKSHKNKHSNGRKLYLRKFNVFIVKTIKAAFVNTAAVDITKNILSLQQINHDNI